MDNRKKRQKSEEETVEAQPVPLAPSAQSPIRPLSRRRRQRQPAEPAPAVERPEASSVFDASPTTIAATLAKAGRSTADPVRLAWLRRGAPDPNRDPAHSDTGVGDEPDRPLPPDAA